MEQKRKLKRKILCAVAEVLLIVLLMNTERIIPPQMEVTGIAVRLVLSGIILYLCYIVFEQ